eukprot:CAMPEP_0174762332 /NCGR_PEP_ID=MMETSP1094-20130205/109727_1 /TAXON_ID=156173 /ORGANISM="Chrysochromulina brevifilum, Strain UTEX LB 985" /LENGTH=155 /DNA_ID=CAMNT_0015968285 /DNA_START=339 /DNA_END=807 /DNA_ORIENTATION=+
MAVQPAKRPPIAIPEEATTSDVSAPPTAPTQRKRSHQKMTRASLTQLSRALAARKVSASASPMHVPQAHAGRIGEPKPHGGVIGDDTAMPMQKNALDRRLLPRAACGSSWSTLRPARTGEQHEVDGHEPARPEMSPGTQATRPRALAPHRKSSMR